MSKDDQQVMETSPSGQRLRPHPATVPGVPPSERVAAWVLDGPLGLALLGLCGFQLATWVPHYLTWPWFADHDVFATMALGWEHGQLPYRDLLGNNFPGTIYLFWVLGKLFGWGRTVPFYAVDAGFVLIFGCVLLAWSRRRFGRFLPGLFGLALFLTYYLSLDFGMTAQRDWQGPFFMVVGLLLVDAYPGRWTRRLSALTTAVAFAIRPQIVLMVPALLLAIAQGTREEPEPTRARTARALLGWGTLAAALVVAAFAPLFLSGIWDDFLRGIGHAAYGGTYNKVSLASIGKQSLLQFLHLKFDLIPIAVLVMYPLCDPRARGSVRVWLLAYLGTWLYKPLSPMPLPYLEHPLTLVGAINVAVLVHLLLLPGLASPAFRLVAMLLILAMGVQARPLQCSVRYALRGIEDLRRGRDPVKTPQGLYVKLPLDPRAISYPWVDYRETLAYLRSSTRPGTRVANLVHVVPALNGPSGRLTPLPVESLAWLNVRPDDERAFRDAIARAPSDTVVVWTPQMGKFEDIYGHYEEVERIAPTIRRYYAPEARFGDVEVWRRKPEGPSPASPPR
jgi:hypothetical protein